MVLVCTGTYYLRNVAKRYRSVHTGTYQYKKMSKSTYAYVLNCVQSGTGQYSKVHWQPEGSTQVKVQQGTVTRQYMAVHVSTRSAFAQGRGRGGGGGAADFGALFKSLH